MIPSFRREQFTRRCVIGAWSLLACMTPELLIAQTATDDADSQTLQEVVVTAQKREQSLQDVGVSVTALSSSDLQKLGVTDSLQIGSFVPNLQLISTSGGNQSAELTIRGISQTDYSLHQESPNSMYIDDVYMSSPNMQGVPMYDVERVEVLRGPQGTLFGRNSTGGLINFITARPSSDTNGYIDVTGGEYGEIRTEGAFGGALSDRVQGRISGLYQSNDGYITNNFPGEPNLNNTDSKNLRGQLLFKLTDDIKLLVSASFNHDDDREGYYDHTSTYPNPQLGGRDAPEPKNVNYWNTCPGCDALGYAPLYTGLEGYNPFVGFFRRQLVMYSARLDWNLGPATLTALSNYSTLESHYDEACGGSAPQDTCRDPEVAHLKQWSQELRLSGSTDKLNWVGGVYGLNIHQDDIMYLFLPYFANTPYASDSFNNLNQRVTDGAIFGQVDYLFTTHWRGTLGLRETHEQKAFSSQTYYNQLGDFVSSYATYNPPLLVYNFSPPTVGDLATQTHTDWSGKAEIDYIANKDALFYGSVSRGIKGAGFNSNLSGFTSNHNTPFGEEHVLAYELGEKLTLLGNTLRVNGDVFYYQYHDFQAYQIIGISPFVTNNDARFSGAELEANARVAGAWDLHAGGAHLTTTVYDVHTANIGVVDQEASDAPKWSGNALVRYNLLLGDHDVYAQWSADYIAGRYHSVDNVPAVYIHSSIGHNVRLGYSYDKQWDVSAWCNNVLNAARQTTAYDLTSTAGYNTHTYMPSRWWGVTLRYSFH